MSVLKKKVLLLLFFIGGYVGASTMHILIDRVRKQKDKRGTQTQLTTQQERIALHIGENHSLLEVNDLLKLHYLHKMPDLYELHELHNFNMNCISSMTAILPTQPAYPAWPA